MPSQAEIKFIHALRMGKYRQKYGHFVVEGLKSVSELIHSDYEIAHLLVTSEFMNHSFGTHKAEVITEKTMEKISQQDKAPGILAVARTRYFTLDDIDFSRPIVVALDGIANPGNMGTIIRTADWYGINQFLLSENCADFYNIKTLMATMGSFVRTKFCKADLAGVLKNRNTVGCFLEGTPAHLYKQGPDPIVLVVGSESHGISSVLEEQIRQKITIKGAGNSAESLNAAVAAGIVLDRLCNITV